MNPRSRLEHNNEGNGHGNGTDAVGLVQFVGWLVA